MRRAVLDHGYLEAVEYWGSDERIVEAARMSTAKGFLGWGELRCSCGAVGTTAHYGSSTAKPGDHFTDDARSRCPTERGGAHVVTADSKHGDEKLLRYLWENRHATPFEMAGMVIEVQAPIMVFREWHRHRTQSYNEMSARYVPLPDVNYVPSVERLLINSKTNKQAGTVAGAAELTEDRALWFQAALRAHYASNEETYQLALGAGVPKELARVHLPVGRYSHMRASANLRCWLMFLTLRLDEAAQFEIRQYAQSVAEVLRDRFPRTMGLFDETRK